MANKDIMNVMSMLGDVLNGQIEEVKQQAEESKKKIESEVSAITELGKSKLAAMDSQFNERFTTQDKKIDQKLAEFKAHSIQPADVKITGLESKSATMEVKQNGLETNIKELTNRVNKVDETFKAISVILTKKP